MKKDSTVGFVKGELCAVGLATQAEDLYAAGVEELIHVGFAGGHNGCKIGDYVITNGAYSDLGFPKLYGQYSDLIKTTEELRMTFAKK